MRGRDMWREWERRGTLCKLLVRKPEGKRPLGRPRRRWIDTIKMDLIEIGLGVVHWISLAQWRAVVNTLMNLRIP
jgi:hypothetical protein